MPLYRDRGVVLRTHKLGEADRIVTVLTREHGRVRAVAKGVRRTSSKFGARLEPLMHVDLQFAEGRSLDVVTQVEAVDLHGERIAADYGRWTAAVTMAEAAERLTAEEKEPALQQYLLLVRAVRAMADAQRPPGVLLDAYLLRALAVAGFAPSLVDCAGCGTAGPHRWFAVPVGGVVCDGCRRTAGATAPGEHAIRLLGALLAGDWGEVDDASATDLRVVSGLVAAFTQWYLERGLKALRHVER